MCKDYRRNDMGYLSTSEIAKKWNVSRRRVSTLCAEGRIEGAMFTANTWLVPEDAQKPVDPRLVRKNGQQKE